MNFPKSKFRMKITIMEKVDKDGKEAYKLFDSFWLEGNGKVFRESLAAEREAGRPRDIKVVYEEPKKFRFNEVYMLATRDVVWIWKLKED